MLLITHDAQVAAYADREATVRDGVVESEDEPAAEVTPVRGLRGDALLAWALLRGSPRSEWWRLALTALGAALGTGFALAAAVVAVIGTRYADGTPRYTNDLLNARRAAARGSSPCSCCSWSR